MIKRLAFASVALAACSAGSTNAIGSAGGVYDDGLVRIEVPAGAVDEPVQLSAFATYLMPPSGLVDYGPIWQLSPDGTVFHVTATVQIAVDGTHPDARLYEKGADGSFVELPSTEAGDRVIAQVTRLDQAFAGNTKDQ